ncbi:MAG TPA: hypothetical protein VEB21_05495, partial [Terriglobales bacterium]|nr:hypothetical protein [Terriglobales bacterium]
QALGMFSAAVCPSFDSDGNEQVTVDEIMTAVDRALTGCVAAPTATVAATETPTVAATATAMVTETMVATVPATNTPTTTAIATATATADGSATPPPTATGTVVATETVAATATADMTPLPTEPSTTPTLAATGTAGSETPTEVATTSPTPVDTATPVSETPAATATATDSGETPVASETPTPAATATAGGEETATAAPSESPTAAGTETATASVETATPELTATTTTTGTPASGETATPTPAATETPTAAEASATATKNATQTPSASPTATPSFAPAGMPAGLAAVVSADAVELSWAMPNPSSGNTEVLVMRRLNDPASGPDDAEAVEVFRGAMAAAEDALIELLPTTGAMAREYFYTAYGCQPGGGDCDQQGVTVSVEPTLIEVLRAGGYVLHWRHAAADVCADNLGLGTAATTTSPDWWRSCEATCATATARQLNPEGVNQSTEIGNQLRARNIAFDRVLSSEFCRNFTTAELMNLGPEVELLPEITYFVYDEVDRCESSYELIERVPATGTNTAIIGHAGFSPSCLTLGTLAWGQAAIFKPDGNGNAQLIALVQAHEWASL